MSTILPHNMHMAQGRVSRLLSNIKDNPTPTQQVQFNQNQPPLLVAPNDLFSKVSQTLNQMPSATPSINFIDSTLPLKPLTTPSIYTQNQPIQLATTEVKPTAQIGKAQNDLPSGPIYNKSKHHDPNKFIPKYPIMAYHESGEYRKQSDPYAVGAISNPTKKGDPGGKTYGIYQFESYVYRKNSNGVNPKGSTNQVKNSTLMRFLNSKSNPFATQLKAVADKHGIASDQFDSEWKKLSTNQNKAFGIAQQNFIIQDKKAKANSFLNSAQVSDKVKNDPRIIDLVLGTKNQVDNLSNKIPALLASLQKSKGRKLTPNEVGTAIIKIKIKNISNWFVSSKKSTQLSIKNRYIAEAKIFK